MREENTGATWRNQRPANVVLRTRHCAQSGEPAIDTYDIAIVGAGPAGLSAALYAARYCRRTLVLHDGTARASRIPLTHNAPGFDAGIAGTDLLERMTRHAQKFGAQLVKARVVKLTAPESQFLLEDEKGAIWSEIGRAHV